MLNKAWGEIPNSESRSLLPRVCCPGLALKHPLCPSKSLAISSRTAHVCLSRSMEKGFALSPCKIHPTLGFLSMSNHLLKCQVVFRKMRKIVPMWNALN